MFLTHYDNSFINCKNVQFDYLMYITKELFEIYDRYISEVDMINALYENDSIFYSAKFLFKSRKNIEDLHPNYCCLARLIYIHYTDIIYEIELNTIISSMCKDKITIEKIYSKYY